jgi:hypothetical protein
VILLVDRNDEVAVISCVDIDYRPAGAHQSDVGRPVMWTSDHYAVMDFVNVDGGVLQIKKVLMLAPGQLLGIAYEDRDYAAGRCPI